MRRHFTLLLAAALAAVLALAALATASTPTRSVKIGDYYFVHHKPGVVVHVKKNTRVVWRFQGQDTHNVTVSKGPVKFHSRDKDHGTYARKMTRKGTYRIYCSIHGSSVMRMTLVVK
ncbi:MAG: hypothetical protein QOK31_785 [Solirubrobacteraceae bacterium]|jgi:plastocyanin|nr:hypothetical protein [Solirubrobacteraceae bacterium]